VQDSRLRLGAAGRDRYLAAVCARDEARPMGRYPRGGTASKRRVDRVRVLGPDATGGFETVAGLWRAMARAARSGKPR
jgi:hypothetical protein